MECHLLHAFQLGHGGTGYFICFENSISRQQKLAISFEQYLDYRIQNYKEPIDIRSQCDLA